MDANESKTTNEILGPWQRWLEVAIVVMLLLFLSFLLYHQRANTGFFTAKFGPLEMLCLYGPLLLSLAAPVVRILTGRRNPGRPFEAATSLIVMLGSLWLLIAFPFDFTHLADALPAPLRFILGWVTDDLGRIPLILQIIINPIAALSATWKYLVVRQEEEAYLKRRMS
jgi:hypothetical protein